MKRLWNSCEMSVVMVTHDLREAFTLATRIIAFERRRNGDDRARYGAVVAKDIEVWPRRIAGHTPADRDDPISADTTDRDGPAHLPR